jgi:hypothetical protein
MTQTENDFQRALKAARRVSTPLVAVRTFDPARALEVAVMLLNMESKGAPALRWDIMRGPSSLNEAGRGALAEILDGREPETIGPTEMLTLSRRSPEDTIIGLVHCHRFWNDPAVMQGIWNLRDVFKVTGCMLLMLVSPGARLPEELVQDVMVLDQPLPTATELEQIVHETFKAADIPEPGDEDLRRAVDAMIGLASFPAEQVLAMSLSQTGLSLDQLWERKRQVIAQTPGLSVYRGGETFNDIGGCENVKCFLHAVLHGVQPPRVVVFIDEIEKALAGTGTDLSGVKTEMAGTLLTWLQDHEAEGTLFLGPPGAAKSAVGKAAGSTAGVPTIVFDLAAMQNSLVGASGERLRAALQVVEAVSQGRSLWIATCNSIISLPPELRRRFTLGTFFFDLPTSEEREVIWQLYLEKYGVEGDLPSDEGWTGAEIKECCRKAAHLRMSLREAATYIVPVSRSAAEQMKALRQMAAGRFLSASKAGVYHYEEETGGPDRRVIRRNEPVTVLPPARSEA